MVSTDEALMTRMVNRDRSAFAEFYDRHAPRVLGYLVKLLHTRGDADDVLQEVFWKVWKNAEKFDASRGSPAMWLFLMARSRATDFLRRRKMPLASEETEPAFFSPPVEELERLESGDQVRHALDQLPEEQRKAIHLSFYDGLPHREIAEQLEVPLGTAKTRIRLGMKRLRELLADVVDPELRLARGV